MHDLWYGAAQSQGRVVDMRTFAEWMAECRFVDWTIPIWIPFVFIFWVCCCLVGKLNTEWKDILSWPEELYKMWTEKPWLEGKYGPKKNPR